MVLAPVVRGRKGEYGKLLEELRGEGFTRVKVDGEVRQLDEQIELDKKYKHDISVVVDRLVMRAGPAQAPGRLDRDRGGAGRRAGRVELVDERSGAGSTECTFSEKFACPEHGPSLAELEPRIFSFNSPHGACPRCTGLGSQMEIDPELIVPDPSLSIGEGAILPWSTSTSHYYDEITSAIAEKLRGRSRTGRGRSCRPTQRDLFLYGTNGDRVYVSYRNRFGRKRSYTTRFEGIVPNLERRYRETDSDYSREKIEEYMSVRPCPECGGARLKPESRAVTVDGMAIHEFTMLSARRALEWLTELRADRRRSPDRAADPARDRGAAQLPRQRRRGLPVDRAGRGDAVGRRGAADPPGHPDRVVARRRALHPRRALDRAAPARQRAADRDARAPARPRQHRDRGRARRGHDARGRPPDRPRARGGRARRRRGGRGDGDRGRAGEGVADRAVPGRAHARSSRRSAGAGRAATSRSRAPRSTTSPTST